MVVNRLELSPKVNSNNGGGVDEAIDETHEDTEAKAVGCTTKTEKVLSVFCNAIFIKAFVLTFVAEWGDRSQISTIGLAVSTVSYFGIFQTWS